MRYEDVDWTQASCHGVWTEMFFIENTAEAALLTPALRRLCRDCPIVSDCREYAIWHENQGFWGGLTVNERHKLRARLNRSRHAA
jgi:WhiB family transcriptional regulator, redox-sensing transcriptional regulator